MNSKTIQAKVREAVNLLQDNSEKNMLVEVLVAFILGDMKHVSNYLTLLKKRAQGGVSKIGDAEVIKILTLLLGHALIKTKTKK